MSDALAMGRPSGPSSSARFRRQSTPASARVKTRQQQHTARRSCCRITYHSVRRFLGGGRIEPGGGQTRWRELRVGVRPDDAGKRFLARRLEPHLSLIQHRVEHGDGDSSRGGRPLRRPPSPHTLSETLCQAESSVSVSDDFAFWVRSSFRGRANGFIHLGLIGRGLRVLAGRHVK